MENGQIVDAWQAPDDAIWESVLGLSHSRYLLGSAHPHAEDTGAVLRCSSRDPESAANREHWRRYFNKRLSSRIDHLARTTDANLFVRGVWYERGLAAAMTSIGQ